ncbi:tRNA N(3)-methylcytidine methyltransferase METTL2-like isoform X2 [Gigantopelta aegis]|uniref:tRNA N(3)-methylcytidine methyltransferase METTL2-like isoform X2 n=1 Tax=Gigantopelta aegis TaxID=1735272 RepID=UPI001B8879C0|nr:tRNA N(3)-methylcytidine methyltransferase METTL2-like isoform X2 [Gigantopelta aegis]
MASGMSRNDEQNISVKPQFGTRFLTDSQNVFQHNAWDNVVWDSEQEDEARKKTEEQADNMAPEDDVVLYEEKAGQFWDEFYNVHTNRFFKDRHWLFTEFPELYTKKCEPESQPSVNDKDQTETPCLSEPENCETDNSSDNPCGHLMSECHSGKDNSVCERDLENSGVNDMTEKVGHVHINEGISHFPGENAKFRILEVGCGVGNTVYPVLQTNNDPDLMVYCCDFSPTAIQLVKEHLDYDPAHCHAFVCDITADRLEMPFPENSLDVVIMIFVLSAINPQKMQAAVDYLAKSLKPGGLILFRDYGRYDLAQLRFKKGRCLSRNFYVRGDGTRVYFFTQDELKSMFEKAGLVEVQNLIDRRLQVNRGKQLKMYRVWIQCKYKKPEQHEPSS